MKPCRCIHSVGADPNGSGTVLIDPVLTINTDTPPDSGGVITYTAEGDQLITYVNKEGIKVTQATGKKYFMPPVYPDSGNPLDITVTGNPPPVAPVIYNPPVLDLPNISAGMGGVPSFNPIVGFAPGASAWNVPDVASQLLNPAGYGQSVGPSPLGSIGSITSPGIGSASGVQTMVGPSPLGEIGSVESPGIGSAAGIKTMVGYSPTPNLAGIGNIAVPSVGNVAGFAQIVDTSAGTGGTPPVKSEFPWLLALIAGYFIYDAS